MVLTRTNLDLSKISIYQVISDREEEPIAQSSTSNQNINMTDPHSTNLSSQSIKSNSSIIKIDSSPSTHGEITDTKTGTLSQLENQTITTSNTVPQFQSTNHFKGNHEDKELNRIPYYNGKTNIFAWLIAVKSIFVDLKYDEDTWTNKAKYYLLDHAAEFAYLNDDEMTNWSTFKKFMIDQYSTNTTTADPTYSLGDSLSGLTMASQQHSTYSSDALAKKAHHALVLEDLKTLPKFSGEGSQSINSWLEEIELVYDKAFITDTDKCHRTLKLLSNADEKWLEFIRRQKLEWNAFKQKLISRFEGKKDSSRIQREDDVRNRRYYNNESMHHYYSDIMRKCDLLEEEYPVSDRYRVDYIIRGLPDSIQDQLLVREYSTPKDLLEVLQKIEEHRKRANFEQHVVSIDETVSSQATKRPLPHHYNVNQSPSSSYQNLNYHTPSQPLQNYNQQHPQQQQRSIQCYNCGKYGHKASECFKPKQYLN